MADKNSEIDWYSTEWTEDLPEISGGFVRGVGCKGTDISLRAHPKGVLLVVRDDLGGGVSLIPWEEYEAGVKLKPWVDPNPKPAKKKRYP